ENVSMRAIAQKSGIRVSSIYNHFGGKEKILEAIYQYFIEHMFDSAATVESLRQSGHEPTLSGIMQAANWSFQGLPPKMYRRMTGINRLIYTRFLHDPRANLVFREHLLKRHKLRRKEMFEYARSLGLIAPEAYIDEMSILLVFVRLMITIVGLARDYAGEPRPERDRLGELMLQLLETALRQPAG
ncbi:MAG: TetR/AcrR family transcriptional regulator, partial [Candidatus Adiutrix sp.]|nr:TetR/AcrR family transcriptional regulator [Candidatus Adiutrix sp.]